tara:strand:+ start:500 stop:1594 length:1095 start_codon:yes stop_codon:yes gene_type:complete
MRTSEKYLILTQEEGALPYSEKSELHSERMFLFVKALRKTVRKLGYVLEQFQNLKFILKRIEKARGRVYAEKSVKRDYIIYLDPFHFLKFTKRGKLRGIDKKQLIKTVRHEATHLSDHIRRCIAGGTLKKIEAYSQEVRDFLQDPKKWARELKAIKSAMTTGAMVPPLEKYFILQRTRLLRFEELIRAEGIAEYGENFYRIKIRFNKRTLKKLFKKAAKLCGKLQYREEILGILMDEYRRNSRAISNFEDIRDLTIDLLNDVTNSMHKFKVKYTQIIGYFLVYTIRYSGLYSFNQVMHSNLEQFYKMFAQACKEINTNPKFKKRRISVANVVGGMFNGPRFKEGVRRLMAAFEQAGTRTQVQEA